MGVSQEYLFDRFLQKNHKKSFKLKWAILDIDGFRSKTYGWERMKYLHGLTKAKKPRSVKLESVLNRIVIALLLLNTGPVGRSLSEQISVISVPNVLSPANKF